MKFKIEVLVHQVENRNDFFKERGRMRKREVIKIFRTRL